MNEEIRSLIAAADRAIKEPRLLCPCHCTCFHALAAIQAAIPIKEVCVGDVLKFI